MDPKNTNEKAKQNKKQFNAVDFLVLVIVLGVLTAAAFAYVPGLISGRQSSGSYVQVKFVIRNADAAIFSGIESGDKVLCEGKDFGSVITVGYYKDEKGADTGDLLVTIGANAKEFADHYEISGINVSSGLEYELEFNRCIGRALCRNLAVGGAQ